MTRRLASVALALAVLWAAPVFSKQGATVTAIESAGRYTATPVEPADG